MYNNHNSTNKEESRQAILDIVGNRKKLNIFTLPSTNFSLERRLSGHRLICAEHNTDVFLKQCDIQKPKNIELFLGDAFDVLQYKRLKYDVVWLDLCGPLTIKTTENLLELVKNIKFKEELHLAITVAAAREGEANIIKYVFDIKNMSNFRDKIFPQLIKEKAVSVGRKCDLIYKQGYRENKTNAMPMKMYIFKINKDV